MAKRDVAFVNVFIATVPFWVFVLAKGFAGKGQPANALSAPDDFMLAFGIGITVLAAITASRRRLSATPLFWQAVSLMLMSAIGYASMTICIDNHLGLNAWYGGSVVLSMLGSVFVAWKYVKVGEI